MIDLEKLMGQVVKYSCKDNGASRIIGELSVLELDADVEWFVGGWCIYSSLINTEEDFEGLTGCIELYDIKEAEG